MASRFCPVGYAWPPEWVAVSRSARAFGCAMVWFPLVGPERWLFVFPSEAQASAWLRGGRFWSFTPPRQRGCVVRVRLLPRDALGAPWPVVPPEQPGEVSHA